MTRLRSWFFTHRIEPNVVVVIDCSGAANCDAMSVTEDIENVVAWLYETRHLRDGDRLVYCDTEKKWGGMLHAGGKFTGFLPLGADTTQQALERWDLLFDVPDDEQPGDIL